MISFSYMLSGFSGVNLSAVMEISVEVICDLIWRDSMASSVAVTRSASQELAEVARAPSKTDPTLLFPF